MAKFDVTVNVIEEASIDYTIVVDARDKSSAIRKIEKAIEEDGTAFIQYESSSESIIDTFSIDGENEEVVYVVESQKDTGDDSENHF